MEMPGPNSSEFKCLTLPRYYADTYPKASSCSLLVLSSTMRLVNCPTRQSLLLFIGSLHWSISISRIQIAGKYSTTMCYGAIEVFFTTGRPLNKRSTIGGNKSSFDKDKKKATSQGLPRVWWPSPIDDMSRRRWCWWWGLIFDWG